MCVRIRHQQTHKTMGRRNLCRKSAITDGHSWGPEGRWIRTWNTVLNQGRSHQLLMQMGAELIPSASFIRLNLSSLSVALGQEFRGLPDGIRMSAAEISASSSSATELCSSLALLYLHRITRQQERQEEPLRSEYNATARVRAHNRAQRCRTQPYLLPSLLNDGAPCSCRRPRMH